MPITFDRGRVLIDAEIANPGDAEWVQRALTAALALAFPVVPDAPYIYEVVLHSSGECKIDVIKAIRAYAEVTLKDAKDAIEHGAPTLLMRHSNFGMVRNFVAALKAVGATAGFQPSGAEPRPHFALLGVSVEP